MKLSQWHDGSVKPVHVGVYERKMDSYDTAPFWSSLWDGERWHTIYCNKDAAARSSFISIYQNIKWRGIVKDKK